MKTSFPAVAALVFCSGPVIAADYSKPSPVRIYVAAPVWNGAIFGVQAGYGWGSSPIGLYTIAQPSIAYDNLDPNGYFGGVHAGYGFQFGGLALGVIADAELASISQIRNDVTVGGALIPAPGKVRIGWNASLRARAGYAIIPDLLIYATGGLAFASMEVVAAYPAPASASETVKGWTFGGGAAYALTRGISATIEYRYSRFGEFSQPVAPPLLARSELQSHSLRTGLTFRFGG